MVCFPYMAAGPICDTWLGCSMRQGCCGGRMGEREEASTHRMRTSKACRAAHPQHPRVCHTGQSTSGGRKLLLRRSMRPSAPPAVLPGRRQHDSRTAMQSSCHRTSRCARRMGAQPGGKKSELQTSDAAHSTRPCQRRAELAGQRVHAAARAMGCSQGSEHSRHASRRWGATCTACECVRTSASAHPAVRWRGGSRIGGAQCSWPCSTHQRAESQ
jgi:hypothetical protein